MIIIPIKWLFHWEYTQHFQTNPYGWGMTSSALHLANATVAVITVQLGIPIVPGPCLWFVGWGGESRPKPWLADLQIENRMVLKNIDRLLMLMPTVIKFIRINGGVKRTGTFRPQKILQHPVAAAKVNGTKYISR